MTPLGVHHGERPSWINPITDWDQALDLQDQFYEMAGPPAEEEALKPRVQNRRRERVGRPIEGARSDDGARGRHGELYAKLRSQSSTPSRNAFQFAPELCGEVSQSRACGKARGRTSRELQIGFRKDVGWRGKFIEFGTRTREARPFLRPAFDATKETALGIMVGALGRGITAAALKLGKRK